MARAALLLTTFAALAAWAGAQGTAPLPPDVQAKLFRANRTLVENLVNDGVALADASDPLARAEGCLRTARTLANDLKRAGEDADRVAELADLMGVVVRDGLAPNADEADRTIPANSKELRDRLAKAQTNAAGVIDEVRQAVPAGKVGDSPKVKAALDTLAALKSKFAK